MKTEETGVVTKGGVRIFIRPIRPDDGPLLVDLFQSLSPKSIYLRFFSPLRNLTPQMVSRLTHIDPDREMALVALEDGPAGNMIGVCRLVKDPAGSRAEVAVVVGDPWQGKGVGAKLLEHGAALAKARGTRILWGLVLPENTTMLAMARKAGADIKLNATRDAYELEMDLSTLTEPLAPR